MPTRSPNYGLRLPVLGEEPDMPEVMEAYTEDLEPILSQVEQSAHSATQVAQEATEQAQNATVQADIVQSATLSSALASRYAISFADSAGFEAGGFTDRAVLDLAHPVTVRGVGGVMAQPVDSTEWAFAVSDREGSVAFGVRQDGSVFPASSGAPGPEDLSKLASDIAGLTRAKTTAVTAIGDSLTYGFFDGRAQGRDGWPDTLKTLTSATVTNAAMSGYTVDEAGIRASFIQPLVTVEGGRIPASGDVPITVKNAGDYDWTNRSGSAFTVNILGSLAGVPGRFKRNSDGSFTFSRASTGEAVAIPADTPFLGELAGHWDETLVIFLGRNNVARNAYGTAAGSVPAQVLASVKKILGTASPGIKQALVISVTTGTWEKRGTAGYQMVQEINDLLATEFPTRFFNLRSYLVKQAIYDLRISPTPEDIAAMEGDTLPPSIMAFSSDGATRDGVHYSRETAKLVGARIFEELSKRGWVQSA